MKYYESVNVKLKGSEPIDEFTAYSGIDKKKALEEAYADWHSLSDFNKEHSFEEVREYDLSDDTDLSDEDELINAICDCTGYDVLVEYRYGFKEQLRAHIECSGLSQNAFSQKLKVPLRTVEAWLGGKRLPNSYTQESILKQAAEIVTDSK